MTEPPEFPGSRRLRRVATPATSKGRAYEGAFEAVGSILISTGIGYWVDHRWETEPWGLLVGAAIGFAAFVLRLVRLGQRAYAESSDGDRGEADGDEAARDAGGRAGARGDANQSGADAEDGSAGREERS